MPGAGSGSACARQAAVNESAGDERLVTDEEIVAVVVVVAMVGMVVAGMCTVQHVVSWVVGQIWHRLRARTRSTPGSPAKVALLDPQQRLAKEESSR